VFSKINDQCALYFLRNTTNMPDVEDNQEQGKSHMSSLRDHFDAELTESWADLILIVSSFITGLLDSAVFNVWSCFVSMQTGEICH
jgi:hypothetical protein